jgi:2-haloacid dehalogenase
MNDSNDGRASRRFVIFDFGGVLIDWNPRHLYRKLLPDDASIERFLTRVCTTQWNEQLDQGRAWSEAIAELVDKHPDDRHLIEAYRQRWTEMISGPIAATVAIAADLKQRGVPLYGLTNWSAETFPYARQRFDFLDWFDGIVVSGEEGVVKPAPEIFRILLERFDLNARDAVFIDDNLRNVEAAAALGIASHHFDSAAALRRHLADIGML